MKSAAAQLGLPPLVASLLAAAQQKQVGLHWLGRCVVTRAQHILPVLVTAHADHRVTVDAGIAQEQSDPPVLVRFLNPSINAAKC